MARQFLLFLLLQCYNIVFVWSVMTDAMGLHRNHATPSPTPSPTTREACAELINHGSHFGVEVEVGTPGQKFDVVADTGSNTLIIPSCQCMKSGACNKDDRCFIGTNRSSTFKFPMGPLGPERLHLHFGSGPIAGVKALDVVRVGQLKHYMQKGLMLMTSHWLNFKMPFEGILGLGIPPAKPAQPHPPHLPGLLEQSGVDRFSMCFKDGSNGVLRLGSPRLVESHASIGLMHWGVGMTGISTGNSTLPLSICAGTGMRKDQETPCGAVPDSGTTMITGPRAQLSMLFNSICDAWPRCKQNHTALVKAAEDASEAAKQAYGGVDPFHINLGTSSKEFVLKQVLSDCTRWLNEGTGLGELPDLHFHITGGGGTAQTLSLPGSSYVLERQFETQPDGHSRQRTEHTKCILAFQAMEYNTWKNGPVWILGTPFFYEYQIGFDMGTKPASMSFASLAQSPCGTCDKQAGLVTSDTFGASQSVRLPRWLPGAPREPRIDVNQPL